MSTYGDLTKTSGRRRDSGRGIDLGCVYGSGVGLGMSG